jgi:S-adenosylmethionine:tRNA ribosyltransferase-isomerase
MNAELRTADFSYGLPVELIAQEPTKVRDASRLLALGRSSGDLSHHLFSDLPSLLQAGDLLVLNDTKVIPARLVCRRPSGGAAEILLTERTDRMTWKGLVRPGRRLPPGALVIPEGMPQVAIRIAGRLPDGGRVITLDDNTLGTTLDKVVEVCGRPPLPPYIEREDRPDDRERYQTVYARQPGAVAAPTAGLHFTPALFERLKVAGVAVSYLTLHVGVGTFRPVKEEDPRKHHIHSERFSLPQAAVDAVNQTRARGGRVIAVGTTSVRVLEYCAEQGGGRLAASEGCCDLYILPGFRFSVVDGLITNFHLPRSSLLMLVSAFAGRDKVLAAYAEAVRQGYRFYSYGDAMFMS